MNKPLQIRDLLHHLNKIIADAYRKELKKFGLTGPQFLVLRQVVDGQRTIGEISKRVELSYSTVSGIIDRLEREKLVARVRDQSDRRVIWIRGTERVPELMAKVSKFSGEFYQRSFEGFSEEDMDTFIHLMQSLVAKIEEREKAEERR